MDISTDVNQQRDDGQVSVLRSKLQWRAINLGACITRDTGTKQYFTHLCVAVQGSKVQCTVAELTPTAKQSNYYLFQVMITKSTGDYINQDKMSK